jgi:hypothetical protein
MSKQSDVVIIIWDYKEQMDVTELNRALKTIEGPARVYQVETSGDFFAVVVCSASKDSEWAQRAYDRAVDIDT